MYVFDIHMISNNFINFVCGKHNLINWFAWCMVSPSKDGLHFTIPMWTWDSPYSHIFVSTIHHICLFILVYSGILFIFSLKKKKIHIYSCWDFGNHISYLEWLHRKYQGKRGELILNIAWWVLKWANEMILRKPKESTHDTLLMEQKVNLEFTRGFAESTRRRKRESTREIIWQKSVFIDNSLICFWWLQNI